METLALVLSEELIKKFIEEFPESLERIRILKFPPVNLPVTNVIEREDILERERISFEYLMEKLNLLKRDLGEDLYNRLSYEDKIFMLNTADSIDFGHPIDLEGISKEISEYENL
jgi:hypothetical protein